MYRGKFGFERSKNNFVNCQNSVNSGNMWQIFALEECATFLCFNEKSEYDITFNLSRILWEKN